MAAKGVAATLDGLRSRPELNHLRACILGQARPNGRVPIRVRARTAPSMNALVLDEPRGAFDVRRVAAGALRGPRFVSGSKDNTARIAYHGLAP